MQRAKVPPATPPITPQMGTASHIVGLVKEDSVEPKYV